MRILSIVDRNGPFFPTISVVQCKACEVAVRWIMIKVQKVVYLY